VVGGALAGALADASGAAACVSAGFVAASVPALVAYRALGARSLAANLALMAAAGLAVNGPYALITTAVSAYLGSHRSLAGARPAPPRPTPPPPRPARRSRALRLQTRAAAARWPARPACRAWPGSWQAMQTRQAAACKLCQHRQRLAGAF